MTAILASILMFRGTLPHDRTALRAEVNAMLKKCEYQMGRKYFCEKGTYILIERMLVVWNCRRGLQNKRSKILFYRSNTYFAAHSFQSLNVRCLL